MDTPTPKPRKRVSLSEVKQTIEQKTRKAVEAKIKEDLLKFANGRVNNDSSYSLGRYMSDAQTRILTEYIGGYNTKPTKTTPELQAFEASIRDRTVATIATTLADPKMLAQLDKMVAERVEGLIQRHIADTANALCSKFLKDIMAKYETAKLLEVEIDEPEDGENT